MDFLLSVQSLISVVCCEFSRSPARLPAPVKTHTLELFTVVLLSWIPAFPLLQFLLRERRAALSTMIGGEAMKGEGGARVAAE